MICHCQYGSGSTISINASLFRLARTCAPGRKSSAAHPCHMCPTPAGPSEPPPKGHWEVHGSPPPTPTPPHAPYPGGPSASGQASPRACPDHWRCLPTPAHSQSSDSWYSAPPPGRPRCGGQACPSPPTLPAGQVAQCHRHGPQVQRWGGRCSTSCWRGKGKGGRGCGGEEGVAGKKQEGAQGGTGPYTHQGAQTVNGGQQQRQQPPAERWVGEVVRRAAVRAGGG